MASHKSQFCSTVTAATYSCSLLETAVYVFTVLQFVPWAGKLCCEWLIIMPDFWRSAFSGLRAYVLSRSKVLGLLVLALSLAPAGANLVRDRLFPTHGRTNIVNTP